MGPRDKSAWSGVLRGEQAQGTEEPPGSVVHWLGGQRGQLIAEIRLEEGTEANAVQLQLMEPVPERRLIADATDDDVGMLLVGWKKGSRRLDGGMAGLDDLLCGGEVLADQDIHIRNLRHG